MPGRSNQYVINTNEPLFNFLQPCFIFLIFTLAGMAGKAGASISCLIKFYVCFPCFSCSQQPLLRGALLCAARPVWNVVAICKRAFPSIWCRTVFLCRWLWFELTLIRRNANIPDGFVKRHRGGAMSTVLTLMDVVMYVRPTRYSIEETGIMHFINSRGV